MSAVKKMMIEMIKRDIFFENIWLTSSVQNYDVIFCLFENEIVMKGFTVSGNVHCKDLMKIVGQPQL